MSDTKTPGEKKLSVSKLTLKPRTETGVVRQSFSHGRSKQVVVEKVKRRSIGGAAEVKAEPAPVETARKPAAKAKAAPAAAPAEAPKASGVVLRTLTEEERVARAHALADSRVREAEERKIAEEEARRRQSREVVDKTEREAADARKREEDERRKHDEETKRKAGEVAKKRLGEDDVRKPGPGRMALEAEDDDGPPKSRRPGGAARPAAARPAAPRGAPAKERGRLTLVTALRADEVRERSVASFRRRTQRLKGHASNEPKEKLVREVTIPDAITISDLANRMSERAVDVIRLLMQQGQMLQINDVIDADTAQLIAEEMGHSVRRVSEADVEEGLFDAAAEPAGAAPRAPVVTVMGHVDHGKTSLLDAIRQTKVAEGEAGGITQHIGAYTVAVRGKQVTFLDTPGHEAFTAMRGRGAKITDIVILVVAADDGVMPQTIEAINHAKAASVPIIVAINKIDKPGANSDRVKNALSEHGLISESWGGDTIMVEVSAKEKTGLETLLEMILLQSEVLELKADPHRLAKGVVVEAKLERGRGPIATVLVQSGTLRVGDVFVVGIFSGKVRALITHTGAKVQEAGPSIPVEVAGLPGVPSAGDVFQVVKDERVAREIAEDRARKQRTADLSGSAKVTLDDLFAKIKEGSVKELALVIKSDVQGSAEALTASVEKLATAAVKLRVIHSGVGGITESDVLLAAASNAIIIGFNVRPEPKAAALAEQQGVDVRLYTIIYDAMTEIKAAMEGLLEPTLKERILGRAEVRQVFTVSKSGVIAGAYVVDGTITRAAVGVRVLRDNVVVYEGKLGSLRRFKDDVREVQQGYECGISVENFNDIKAGDIIEAYAVDKIAAKL